jgi:hypothetical protein
MRTVFVVVAPLVLLVTCGPAAAAPEEKPVKYEYAELRFVRGFGPMAGPGFPAAGGAPGFPGFPGGGGPPGFPGGGAGPVPVGRPGQFGQATIQWTTGEEELAFKEWEELADRLKAAPAKKESPATVHKLRVLNKLSADGWEILDRPAAEASSGLWTFRRRVP